jgi:methylene-fatty-acyl-phospholipid synthase
MSLWVFLVAAAALSIERICYIIVWRHPESFRAFCSRPSVGHFGAPVAILQKLFYCFKAIQLTVFFGWCYRYGNGSIWPIDRSILPLVLGSALIVAGQTLNLSVFYRLGNIGVFYGDRFGYELPWTREFPFSLLKHPQYAGALLSIWGFFAAMRFPHEDWYMIPALETVYYILGTHFEKQPPLHGKNLVCRCEAQAGHFRVSR